MSADRAATENRETTDGQRLEAFRANLHKEVLPNLPVQDGYRMCWLSTTNPSDSIHWRQQIGYELLKPEMVPGYNVAHLTGSTGDYAGYIMVREMIAARIPETIWTMIMKEAHAVMPREQEDRINNVLEAVKEEAAARKLKIREGEDADHWN